MMKNLEMHLLNEVEWEEDDHEDMYCYYDYDDDDLNFQEGFGDR